MALENRWYLWNRRGVESPVDSVSFVTEEGQVRIFPEKQGYLKILVGEKPIRLNFYEGKIRLADLTIVGVGDLGCLYFAFWRRGDSQPHPSWFAGAINPGPNWRDFLLPLRQQRRKIVWAKRLWGFLEREERQSRTVYKSISFAQRYGVTKPR